MTSIEFPPLPQGLRDMLRDQPDHVERLQEALNAVIENPASGVDPYDRAVWALEGRIETFIAEARKSLRAAEAQNDEALITRAKEHLHLMHGCSSRSLWKASNLLAYFDARQEAGGDGL